MVNLSNIQVHLVNYHVILDKLVNKQLIYYIYINKSN